MTPEAAGAGPLKEHPFAKAMAEYPWLNVFSNLGKLNDWPDRLR
jgi:hypothetical protein